MFPTNVVTTSGRLPNRETATPLGQKAARHVDIQERFTPAASFGNCHGHGSFDNCDGEEEDLLKVTLAVGAFESI